MKLKIYIIIIIAAGLIFVVADYYGYLGTKKLHKADFVMLNFKVIDEEQGFMLDNIKIRCFKKGTNNACAQRDSGKAGIISVNIPVNLVIEYSYLFSQSVIPEIPADPKIHIMFIHNDYARTVETVFYDELLELSREHIVVPMSKSIRNRM